MGGLPPWIEFRQPALVRQDDNRARVDVSDGYCQRCEIRSSQFDNVSGIVCKRQISLNPFNATMILR